MILCCPSFGYHSADLVHPDDPAVVPLAAGLARLGSGLLYPAA